MGEFEVNKAIRNPTLPQALGTPAGNSTSSPNSVVGAYTGVAGRDSARNTVEGLIETLVQRTCGF